MVLVCWEGTAIASRVTGFQFITFLSLILVIYAESTIGPSSQNNSQISESCSSKFEQHNFWKLSGAESEPFIRAVKKYEEFHAKCRSQEKDLDSIIKNKGDLPCKYLLWRAPYVGMGNRILSFVSTYLLALLTNRVMLTDRVWDWETVFCEPFPLSSMLLNTQVDGHYVQNNAMPFDKFVTTGGSKSPFSVVWHITHNSDRVSFCPVELDLLERVPLLVVYSNMYFVPGFYHTSFKAKVQEFFPDKDAFLHLGRYFLNPINKIWGQVKKIHSRNLARFKVRIGMQIRTFDTPWKPEKSDRILECSQIHQLLPTQGPNSSALENGSISCMIASLRPQFYESLKRTFNSSNPETDSVHVFKVGKSLEQDSNSNSHNQEAVVELWLLSFCDHLITSLGSTFGYVAAGLAGKSPIFITGMNSYDRGVADSQVCRKISSPEPCFHFPPSLRGCMEVNDTSWKVQPHLKQCMDFPRGVRIV